MDETRARKMERDFSSEVNQLIPECQEKATNGKVADAVEGLLALEKQTRLAADVFSTEKLLVCVAQILYAANDFDQLNEQIVALSKKRSQLRPAVTKLVQECCKFVEEIKDHDIRLRLIDTLRTVSEGKIYVENERARLTKILAEIRENEDKVDEATKMMIDLQVETYNTMDRREKVNFILEQMRLCLKNNDYIRAQIISKKVSIKYFEDESTHDLKLRFYQLMIQLDKQEGSYLDICKHYYAIYDTPRVKENLTDKQMAIKSVVLYLCMSEYNLKDEEEFLTKLWTDKELEEDSMKIYKAFLKQFLLDRPLMIKWAEVEAKYSAEFKGPNAPDVFHGPNGAKTWKALKDRIVEFNICVMKRYYTQVSLDRMSNLLELSPEEVEKVISKLVFKKKIYARINGLKNEVDFREPRDASKVLDDWSSEIDQLMQLVTHTSHLIDKENMVSKHIKKGTTSKA